MADLKHHILSRISGSSRTSVWTATDFLDLGGRNAVDKALQRLVASGDIRRIDRGLYDQPDTNRLTGQPNPPSPRDVIDAVARRDQVRVLVDGMTAANDLGLTNAVPAKIVVHTDARLRPIKLGNLTISFKPTAASKLYWSGRPAMRVVQALHWLRDTIGDSDDSDDLQRKLTKLLDHLPNGAAVCSDLTEGLQTLPSWMQELLKPVIKRRMPQQ